MKKNQSNIIRSGAKWLPGAAALASGIASTANATVVQITLSGNLSTSGNSLDADFGDDNTADVTLTGAAIGPDSVNVNVNGGQLYAKYGIVGSTAIGNSTTGFGVKASFAAGGSGVPVAYAAGAATQNINYLNPITFTDANINGGATTLAWLQVNAFNSSKTDHTIAFTRVIFDTANPGMRPTLTDPFNTTYTPFTPIPEPGSFALLTLGAAGLIARRRRNQAA